MYDCNCEDCVQTLHATSQLAIGKSKIKPLLTAVEKAFKQLHTKGSYKPQDLAKTAEYKNLIAGTSDIFNTAITDNDIPEAMAKSLKADVFVFSGLKTHAQLAEASKLLLTPEGKIKSFSIFSNDVKSIKENYNQNYLEAEYQFAVSSAQSAGNWANLSNDYDLQYRTAEDDRVRDSHKNLRVTLPQDDAFWISYYPPNGWRCRCTAVQVRKGKFEVSDSKKAIAEGEKATTKLDKNGNNKLAIFRFNPGIQKVVFPPAHPYSKVAGAKEVITQLKKDGKFAEAKTELTKQKQSVYSKPLGKQYSTVFSHKSGGKVDVHELVNLKAEDYKDVLNSAKVFAKEGRSVKLLPEIDYSEKEARTLILKGLKVERSNPDMLVDNEYVDLKRPTAFKNIVNNANGASKQGAIAMISDVNLDKELSEAILKERTKDIFKDKNYKNDKIYFYLKGNLVTKNRTGDK